MKRINIVNAALVNTALLFALLTALSGCQKQGGSADQAGTSIDNAAEPVGEHDANADEAIHDTAKGD